MPATGPRSIAGKLQSRRNAQTHGLSAQITREEDSTRIQELTKILQNGCENESVRFAAERAARAAAGIERVGLARTAFIAKVHALANEQLDISISSGCITAEMAELLLRLLRYERHAMAEWRKASRKLEEAKEKFGLEF